jgi:cyclophilin family peptidyl-prolyl cis-trans isomerase
MESSSKTSLYVGAAALVIVIVLVIIGLRTTKTTTENMPIINQQETTPGAQPADTTPLPTSTTTSPEKTKTMNTATLKTNMGEITITLDPVNAPKTVENFTTLASKGFYDGIRFHRVIKGFMIQAGDPQSKDLTKKSLWGTGGPGYKFDDELSGNETYPQGTVAMANAGPNTNGSQFFIVTASPAAPLPPSYTVFGKVTKGLDVALKIENVKTETADRPVNDVIIEKVSVE